MRSGVSLLKRGRRGVELTRGRRKPARSCPARHPQCRRDARRSRALCLAACAPACICSPIRRAFRNICRRRWRRSCASIPTSRSTSRSARAPTSPRAIATGAADLGFAAEHALPDNIERFTFSEDRLALVTARRGPLAGRRQIDFQEVAALRFRRAHQRDRAAGPYFTGTPRGSARACISARG